MSDETVPVGELVLTSGGDRIFPKGLPVGQITKVSPGSDLFLNIRVKPAISLSRLEEVLVVTKIDEPAGRVRPFGHSLERPISSPSACRPFLPNPRTPREGTACSVLYRLRCQAHGRCHQAEGFACCCRQGQRWCGKAAGHGCSSSPGSAAQPAADAKAKVSPPAHCRQWHRSGRAESRHGSPSSSEAPLRARTRCQAKGFTPCACH